MLQQARIARETKQVEDPDIDDEPQTADDAELDDLMGQAADTFEH